MRSAGILLPVTALPGGYGIGTLGAAARQFLDFLQAGGQRVWQMLPLGPTGFGDSPYQCFSSFAGNPYLIDLDDLCRDGLLKREEYAPSTGATTRAGSTTVCSIASALQSWRPPRAAPGNASPKNTPPTARPRPPGCRTTPFLWP